MKKKLTSPAAFFNPRFLFSFAFCGFGLLLTLAFFPGATAQGQAPQPNGRLSPEDARIMAAGLKPLINDSAEGLVSVRRADGSVSMDLQGRFQNVTVAKKEADGSVSRSCVNNLDAAAGFLGIDGKLLGLATKNQQPQQTQKPQDR
ncbi:MAG TPA: hypothetical protein VK474_12575 [Chthoniobacterales bacterium]|nr:hypothetical protein [Chthoniobacterales bacterium]